jgi:hypothetical protein
MANTEAAAKEKELGNAAYKKKDFPTAIAHYKKVRITETLFIQGCGSGSCRICIRNKTSDSK